MIKLYQHVILVSLLFITGSGCTILPPKPSGRAHMLTLPVYQASSSDILSHRKIDADVIVHYPETANTLEIYRIAIKKADGTLDYIAGNRWADFLPSLVQQTLTETLRHQRFFHTVSTDTQQAGADFRLFTTIESFTVQQQNTGSTVVIEMDIRLYDTTKDYDVFNKHIRHIEPIASPLTMQTIEPAFHQAFIAVQQQLLDTLIAR